MTSFTRIMVSYIAEWMIDKPLDLTTGTCIKSDLFPIGVENVSTWQMSFYPSGSMRYTKDYAAIYLKMIRGSPVKSSSKIALIIKDQIITEQIVHAMVSQESHEYQLDMFARITDISYPLLIRCELKISGETKTVPYMESVDNFNQVSTDIQPLISKEEEKDLLIITREQMKFGAHKIVLAARSKVFSYMFEDNMSAHLKGKVELNDMDGSDVEEFLQYLYSGNLTKWSLPLCMNLFVAGDKYHVNTLKDACSLYIQENINFDASANILVLAHMHGDKILKEVALKFISRNAKSVLKSPGWKTMCHKQQYLVDELILYMAEKLQLD